MDLLRTFWSLMCALVEGVVFLLEELSRRYFLRRKPELHVSSRQTLVGKTGVTRTDLRPSGQVLIDGKQYEATTDGAMIPSGTIIVVVRVTPFALMVRKGE